MRCWLFKAVCAWNYPSYLPSPTRCCLWMDVHPLKISPGRNKSCIEQQRYPRWLYLQPVTAWASWLRKPLCGEYIPGQQTWHCSVASRTSFGCCCRAEPPPCVCSCSHCSQSLPHAGFRARSQSNFKFGHTHRRGPSHTKVALRMVYGIYLKAGFPQRPSV